MLTDVQKFIMQTGASSLLPRARKELLIRSLERTRGIPGSILEVGVYHGGSLQLLYEWAKTWGKQVVGIDTFKGLPKPGEFDDKKSMPEGKFSNVRMDEVQSLVPGASLLAGEFPGQVNIQGPISFCHLDVDFYEGTLQGLKWLGPRISAGGIIVVDDYGYAETPGVKLAVDEFMYGWGFKKENGNNQAVLVKE